MLYINITVFVITLLFPDFMEKWFALSSDLANILEKPWTVFTYAFLHTSRLFHILSNLIVLFFIGNLFLNFLSEKQLLIYYLFGALMGAMLFIVYYALSDTEENWSLLGASAAVTAVFIGIAAKIPRYPLKLRFIGSVELWLLATIWVALIVFGTSIDKAGSSVAHLGGALAGFLLTYSFKEGKGLERFFTRKQKPQKPPFQKVYKNSAAPQTQQSYRRKEQTQRQIDAILDKISKSGYEALSKEEKEFLFNQKEN